MQPRKRFVIVVAILELFVCSCDLASAQQRRKILVAYVAPGITQTIPWVTKEAGIFGKHGIDAEVIIIQMGGIPQVGSALLAGKIDAGVVGESGLLLVQQGRAKPLPGGSAKDLKVPGSGATLTATRRYVARDREGVMRVLRAYVEGIHYF